jgi:hypothetical protein
LFRQESGLTKPEYLKPGEKDWLAPKLANAELQLVEIQIKSQ